MTEPAESRPMRNTADSLDSAVAHLPPRDVALGAVTTRTAGRADTTNAPND